MSEEEQEDRAMQGTMSAMKVDFAVPQRQVKSSGEQPADVDALEKQLSAQVGSCSTRPVKVELVAADAMAANSDRERYVNCIVVNSGRVGALEWFGSSIEV
jgi:hypothetical protein